MVKRATLHTVDYENGRCRVKYQDNLLLSKELVLVATKKPLIGDEVVVIEDGFDGVCLADIYKEVAL
jgi:hypothetical protein